MADLFSENDNRQRLRDHMDIIKLPCIPYLGTIPCTTVDFVLHCPQCVGIGPQNILSFYLKQLQCQIMINSIQGDQKKIMEKIIKELQLGFITLKYEMQKINCWSDKLCFSQ